MWSLAFQAKRRAWLFASASVVVVGMLASSARGQVSINEVDYDQPETDTDEFVEIQGTGGADLTGWTLVFYNGASGGLYDTESLTSIPSDGYLVVGSAIVPNVDIITGVTMQNGAPDGIALCDDTNTVVDMIGYEGSFAAADGCAVGQTFSDDGTDPGAAYESLERCPDGSGAFQLTTFKPSPGSANTCGVAPAININEVDYDQPETDTDEFVEIQGTAGADLTGWTLVFYNGASGSLYGTESLTSIPSDGYLVVGSATVPNVDIIATVTVQNGAPDGIALCNDTNTVVDMIGYEGSFAADGGCAHGQTFSNDGADPGTAYESLERCPDGSGAFQLTTATPSPGTTNTCGIAQPRLPSPPHDAPKNRYISVDPTTNGDSEVAIEVGLASMYRCSGDDRRACIVDGDCPGVCDTDNDLQCVDDAICGGGTCLPTDPCIEHGDVGGVVKYLDTPFESICLPLSDCHACTESGEKCNPDALSACNQGADGECLPTMWFAKLVSAPVYRVWTESTLHMHDCGIVPVAGYAVRATTDGASFSSPLVISTITKPNVHYADCVGTVVAGQFTPADGFTNVTDVQAYLHANQGTLSAPHTTWVDLHGVAPEPNCSSGACIVPQQILNVSDLGTIKFGFLGRTYVETPGQEDPGDCP